MVKDLLELKRFNWKVFLEEPEKTKVTTPVSDRNSHDSTSTGVSKRGPEA